MSVVPTELTPWTLLTLFRRPLQTSSSPLCQWPIFPLFLTMSGIPALNMNLPIFNSCWHLDQPQSITTNTILCLDQNHVIQYTEVLHPCVVPNRLSLTAFCVSDVRPTRSNVPRTSHRSTSTRKSSMQCCTSNTSCTDASYHVNALESWDVRWRCIRIHLERLIF